MRWFLLATAFPEANGQHEATITNGNGKANGSVRPQGPYLTIIIENLRTAGVKGTNKSQRIGFTRLDTFPSKLTQAEGETTDNMTVRVSTGPETGTVGDAWIADAAVEAIKGSQCDLLLVCAFSFEASVHQKTEELKQEMRLGKLRVLPVRSSS